MGEYLRGITKRVDRKQYRYKNKRFRMKGRKNEKSQADTDLQKGDGGDEEKLINGRNK